MSKRSKEVFAGTESELISMTKELDELHHDVGVPAMREGVAAMIDNMEGAVRPTSRRTFLLGAGAAAAGRCRHDGDRWRPRPGRRVDRAGVVGQRPAAAAFPPAGPQG